jgi:hypothetical protein
MDYKNIRSFAIHIPAALHTTRMGKKTDDLDARSMETTPAYNFR